MREGQESILTAQLAMAGYPKSGTLYSSYFENVGTMSTTSERATAWLVAVQERLQATIRQLDGVVDALVNIDLLFPHCIPPAFSIEWHGEPPYRLMRLSSL